MEKIYMDSKGKKPKKQTFLKQLFNDKGSMVALVIVAFVGVLGLMVFGLNQISFAANTTGQLPNSFVSKQGDENVMRLIGTAGYMDNGTFKTTDPDKIQQGVLPILGFYTDGDIPIFCIEYNIGYEVGRTYTKGGEIKDYGLVYLMSQIYFFVYALNLQESFLYRLLQPVFTFIFKVCYTIGNFCDFCAVKV